MSVSSVHTGGQSLPPSVCFSWKPATATASEGLDALWAPCFAVNLIATPTWRWGRTGTLVIIYSARSSWVVAQGVCQRLCEKPVAGGLGSSLQASLLQISFLLAQGMLPVCTDLWLKPLTTGCLFVFQAYRGLKEMTDSGILVGIRVQEEVPGQCSSQQGLASCSPQGLASLGRYANLVSFLMTCIWNLLYDYQSSKTEGPEHNLTFSWWLIVNIMNVHYHTLLSRLSPLPSKFMYQMSLLTCVCS